MKEFRFEVKYMLKTYYNLYIIKEMKRLVILDYERRKKIETEEYALAKKDYDEIETCIKILKDMVCMYYNVEDGLEFDKKLSSFVKEDPYYKLTEKIAVDFLSKNMFGESSPKNKKEFN